MEELTFAGRKVDLSNFGEGYLDEHRWDYCVEFGTHGVDFVKELEKRRVTGGGIVYYLSGPITTGGQYGGGDDAFYDLIGFPGWGYGGTAPAPRVWDAIGFSEDISRSEGLALLRGWFPSRVMLRDRGWWTFRSLLDLQDKPTPEFTPGEAQLLKNLVREAIPAFDIRQVLFSPKSHIEGVWPWVEGSHWGSPLNMVEWTDGKTLFKGDITRGSLSISDFNLVVLSSGVAYPDEELGTWKRRLVVENGKEIPYFYWPQMKEAYLKLLGCNRCGSWLTEEGWPLSACNPADCMCKCHHYFQTLVVADRQFGEKLRTNFLYERETPLSIEVEEIPIKGVVPID